MGLFDRLNGFFRWLLGEPQGRPIESPTPDLVDTAPLHPDAFERASLAIGRETIEAGSAQSAGMERDNNEDSILMLYSNAFGEETLPGFGLFCVADGAGGLGHGELASAIAVKTVARSLMEEVFIQTMEPESDGAVSNIKELAENAIRRANRAVMDGANGGVTTLTIAILLDDRLTIGHVGDSRAYLINGRSMEQLTRDHSFAMRLVEIGQIEPDEAMLHPKRNQLWNAVGQGENVVIEVKNHPMPRSGHLLLCSDGLWGEVPDEQLNTIVCGSSEPNAACAQLVQAANDAGGSDNISALLITFPSK